MLVSGATVTGAAVPAAAVSATAGTTAPVSGGESCAWPGAAAKVAVATIRPTVRHAAAPGVPGRPVTRGRARGAMRDARTGRKTATIATLLAAWTRKKGTAPNQDHRQGQVEDQESGQVGKRVVEHGGNQSSGCGARDGPPGNTARDTVHAAGCDMSDGSGQPHPEHLRQEQERRRRPHRRGDRIDGGSHGPAQEAEHRAEHHAGHGRDHRHDLDVRQPGQQVAATDSRTAKRPSGAGCRTAEEGREGSLGSTIRAS